MDKNRLEVIQDGHACTMSIVCERAEEIKDEVAGGESGLLVRDYKGKDRDRAVYKFDAALAGELREHERQMAVEVGEWQDASGASVRDSNCRADRDLACRRCPIPSTISEREFVDDGRAARFKRTRPHPHAPKCDLLEMIGLKSKSEAQPLGGRPSRHAGLAFGHRITS
jgi:hypothetical protein